MPRQHFARLLRDEPTWRSLLRQLASLVLIDRRPSKQ